MAYTWSFTNGGNTYSSANLVSGSLNGAVYRECSIGNVVGKQLNMRLWNLTPSTTSPIVLSVSDGTTPTKMGTYLIDTFSRSPYSAYADVTAFDAILKADAIFMKEGTWDDTETDSDLVDEIASIIGVTVETNTATYLATAPITFSQAPNIGPNGTTCRQILSVIGCLRGGNWVLNEDDELTFVPLFGTLASGTVSYSQTAISLGDSVVDFDKSDAETIVGIEFQQNGGESFRYPSGLTDDEWEDLSMTGRILYNNLPFMASQEAVDAVGAIYVASTGAAYGIQYIPHTAKSAYLSPAWSLGQKVHIKDTDVFIAERTIDISPLAASDLSATTSRKAESYYPQVSPQTREARQRAEENFAAITVLPSQIMQEVYTKGETDERISSVVTQTANEITTTFTREISDAVGEANQYTDDQTRVVSSYIREYDDGTETGIEIGRSDSPFKAKLSNEELAFTGEDGQKAAWISNNELHVNHMVTPGRTGRWVQQVSNDDHFQIRWVGN